MKQFANTSISCIKIAFMVSINLTFLSHKSISLFHAKLWHDLTSFYVKQDQDKYKERKAYDPFQGGYKKDVTKKVCDSFYSYCLLNH
jgi:hypothetical protein